MFSGMMDLIKTDALQRLFTVQVAQDEHPDEVAEAAQSKRMSLIPNRGEGAAPKTVYRAEEKVGRNDLCPCGSGKKYKKCCGA